MGEDRLRLAAYVAAAAFIAFAIARALGACDAGTAAPKVALDDAPGRAAKRGRSVKTATAYVHVAGAVRQPGLYRVHAGARAGVAVEQAGGLTSGADGRAVNLAARVRDGQQIVVPKRGERPVTPSPKVAMGGAAGSNDGRGAAGTAPAPKISLATATLAQLETLDGIGPALAKRILDYRTQHGGFRTIGQLQEVEGIGEKRFEALRRAVEP